jgi:small subunit ribosomal protein S3
LHTLRADIDYALSEAQTVYGKLGIKVWIFKGEIFGKKDLSPNQVPAETKSAQGSGPRGDRNERSDRGERSGRRNDRGGERGGRDKADGGAPRRNNNAGGAKPRR